MKEKYESLALADLKAIAKSRGIRGTSAMKKAEVVEAMLELDGRESRKASAPVRTESGAAAQGSPESAAKPEHTEKGEHAEKQERAEKPERTERPESAGKGERTDNEKSLADLDSGEIEIGRAHV